jgi:hypothetical protein
MYIHVYTCIYIEEGQAWWHTSVSQLLSRCGHEDYGSRPAEAKLVRPYLKNKLGMVVNASECTGICGVKPAWEKAQDPIGKMN